MRPALSLRRQRLFSLVVAVGVGSADRATAITGTTRDRKTSVEGIKSINIAKLNASAAFMKKASAEIAGESWLHNQVGSAYDALKADPSRAVTIDLVRARLAAEHATPR